jgi:excisionase family DNA binding protein
MTQRYTYTMASPKVDLSKLITSTEAAERLPGPNGKPISAARVRALIRSGRLPAIQAGRDYLINPADLAAVKVRKTGRPPKPA